MYLAGYYILNTEYVSSLSTPFRANFMRPDHCRYGHIPPYFLYADSEQHQSGCPAM